MPLPYPIHLDLIDILCPASFFLLAFTLIRSAHSNQLCLIYSSHPVSALLKSDFSHHDPLFWVRSVLLNRVWLAWIISVCLSFLSSALSCSYGPSNFYYNNLTIGSISIYSSTINVGFIFIVHYNYISYPQWKIHPAPSVACWEGWSLLAAIRIRKCGKSRFWKYQSLAKPETFFSDRRFYVCICKCRKYFVVIFCFPFQITIMLTSMLMLPRGGTNIPCLVAYGARI